VQNGDADDNEQNKGQEMDVRPAIFHFIGKRIYDGIHKKKPPPEQ
jgi:hypothetical protein